MIFEKQHAQLVISAAHESQFPEFSGCEIVMVGKSNVGKSSLINGLTNRKRLAYVGQTPGKTRLINFYEIAEDLMLVDVPGYGFANRSKQEQDHYAVLMDSYFEKRELAVMLILIDSRRGIADADRMMIDFARYHHLRYALVFTKADKLSGSKLRSLVEQVKKEEDADVLVFSDQMHETREPIREYLEAIYHETTGIR